MSNPTSNQNDDTVIDSDATVISADDTVINLVDEQTVLPARIDVSEETTVPDGHTIITGMLDHSLIENDTALTADDTVITVSEHTQGSFTESLIEEPDAEVATDNRPRSAPTLSLRAINGARYSLDRPIIIGRLPQAPRRGSGLVQLVVVPSREGLVSSTHARIEGLGDVVVVTDLNSTNGTRIMLPGRPEMLLAPGDSYSLGEGAVIDLGDGNRLEVLR